MTSSLVWKTTALASLLLQFDALSMVDALTLTDLERVRMKEVRRCSPTMDFRDELHVWIRDADASQTWYLSDAVAPFLPELTQFDLLSATLASPGFFRVYLRSLPANSTLDGATIYGILKKKPSLVKALLAATHLGEERLRVHDEVLPLVPAIAAYSSRLPAGQSLDAFLSAARKHPFIWTLLIGHEASLRGLLQRRSSVLCAAVLQMPQGLCHVKREMREEVETAIGEETLASALSKEPSALFCLSERLQARYLEKLRGEGVSEETLSWMLRRAGRLVDLNEDVDGEEVGERKGEPADAVPVRHVSREFVLKRS